MASTIPLTLFALYRIGVYYLKTSRQMRVLELEAKSPLYKHVTETIEGAMTIRAYRWQEYFQEMAFQKLDDSQRAVYLMICIQRWLRVVIDMIGSVTGIIVVSMAVLRPQSSSGGSIGMALTSILSFMGNMTNLIRHWTQAEITLGAVTRLRAFERDTPTEESATETYDPGETWPVGVVNVSQLGVKYGYVSSFRDNVI
jgi:ATP-binding cassette, subfamily C (CFTR/MRP), member 1